MTAVFASLIVGLVEVGPGVCQMDLLAADGTVHTSEIKCEYVVAGYEPVAPQ